jgi:PIN domain nuclease of toxin-antitoxin system
MTPLLLDTYTLVGVASEPDRLTRRAQDLILDPANPLFVSSFSAYEIGVAVRKQRLALALPPRVWFERALATHSVEAIDVTWQIAAAAFELPPIHWDPGDRIIVATATERDLTLVTPDRDVRSYPGLKTAW